MKKQLIAFLLCFVLGEYNEGGGFSVAWFISSKGYGIYFNNDDVVIDLGTNKEEYSFLVIL